MLNKFGKWIADGYLHDTLTRYFADKLEILGFGAFLVAGLSGLLGVLAVKMLWGVVAPVPDARLFELDPDNEIGLQNAFEDLETVLIVSSHISESPAETFEEFRSQVRRLNLAPETVWDKLDPDNEEVMANLFMRKTAIKGIGQLPKEEPATSVDNLREQVIKIKRLKVNH